MGTLVHIIVVWIGRFLASLPESWIEVLCKTLGWFFYSFPFPRRELVRSNLHHAFPEKPKDWHDRITHAICVRTVEMGLYTITCPFFTKERLYRTFEPSEEANAMMKRLIETGRPILIIGAHFSMIEAFNGWPGSATFAFPECVVMYRPHRNPKIDQVIREHRERSGFKMLSRKQGVRTMGEVLRRNGMAGILFDQNTRDAGSLLPFFGRVTSATELPGLLAKKYKAIPVATASHRTTFWRAAVKMEVMQSCEPEAITLELNAWLENVMRNDEALLVDWLWTHNRWKILQRPHERLGMEHRKKIVDFSNYPERRTRFALVVPCLGDCGEQALMFLKHLRASRPDADLHLVSQDALAMVSQYPELVDRGSPLPATRAAVMALARRTREFYWDLLLVPGVDVMSMTFAKASKVRQRFGVQIGKQKPTALTDAWIPESPEAWLREPDWLAWGRHFGLKVPDSKIGLS